MAPFEAAPVETLRFAGARLELPAGLGSLLLEAADGPGLDPDLVAAGIVVRWREGGEKLRPAADGRMRTVKKLLQETAIVPWMRSRLPLLYAGDELVAIADRFLAAGCQRHTGPESPLDRSSTRRVRPRKGENRRLIRPSPIVSPRGF